MLEIKDIPVYYLNPDFFPDRKNRMEKYLATLPFTNYQRVASNSGQQLRQNRINEGFIALCNKALEDGCKYFLILEDDATVVTGFPTSISLPEQAKLIYWGASLYETGGDKPLVKIQKYNEEYYRLIGSLSCHAILIPSVDSAHYFINVQKKAIAKNEYSDMVLAKDSVKEIFLTPKEGPYIYQNDAHTAPITNFLWKDKITTHLKK